MKVRMVYARQREKRWVMIGVGMPILDQPVVATRGHGGRTSMRRGQLCGNRTSHSGARN